jgi:hypothetical protein
MQGITPITDIAAVWYFVNPLYINSFLKFISKMKGIFSSDGRRAGDVLAEAACLKFMSHQPNAMTSIAQKIGDVVHVPPGWLHAVFTLQPCVKLAWDFICVENLPNYMAAWMHVGVLAKSTAHDYMGTSSVLVQHALENMPP